MELLIAIGFIPIGYAMILGPLYLGYKIYKKAEAKRLQVELTKNF